MITLEKSGRHLWTISIEIQYYFAIPIGCLLVHMINKKSNSAIKFTVYLILLLACWYGSYNNAFGLTEQQIQKEMYIVISTNMKLAFFVFFAGSVLGLFYYEIEQANLLSHPFHTSWRLQQTLHAASFIWMFYVYRTSSSSFQMLSRPGFLWTIFIFLILVSSSEVNLIKKYLERSSLLQSFGKYSFGVYLLHPFVIFLFLKNEFILNARKDLRTCELYGLVLFISYALGYLWYHWLEKHCIKLANKACLRLTAFVESTDSIMSI